MAYHTNAARPDGSYVFTLLWLAALYAVTAAFGYGLYTMPSMLMEAITNPVFTRFAAHWGTPNTNDAAVWSYALLTIGISGLLWVARRIFVPSDTLDNMTNIRLPKFLDGLFALVMVLPLIVMFLFFGAGVIFFIFFAGIPLATVFLLNPIHALFLAFLTAMPFIVGVMQLSNRD